MRAISEPLHKPEVVMTRCGLTEYKMINSKKNHDKTVFFKVFSTSPDHQNKSGDGSLHSYQGIHKFRYH